MRLIKKNISILVVILIFLVILTSYLAIDINAKYITTASGYDQARVARFAIDVDITNDSTDSIINKTINYDFIPGSVINLDISIDGSVCEVATKYTISFETTANLPLTILFNESDVLTTPIVNTLEPFGSTLLENVQIKWPKTQNSYLYSGQVDLIKVLIKIEQID